MKLRLGGVERRGRALDLRGHGVDPETVLHAIRDPNDRRVVCPSPTAVHEHVGLLSTNTDAPDIAALAAVAESLDITVLDTAPPADPVDLRRALADATEDVTRLRERVERASGRLAVRRELGEPTDEAKAALREATRALTDAETEQVAARQRLDAAEARLRDTRSERERELRRTDARRNHPELARRALAERVRPVVSRARAAVPDWNRRALAATRVARIRAPVVVAAGPFRYPAQARACLDAAVVLV